MSEDIARFEFILRRYCEGNATVDQLDEARDALESTIATLRAEVEGLRAVSAQMLKALELAEDRLTLLAEHDQECDLFNLDDEGRHLPCSCGLTLAMETARAAIDAAKADNKVGIG